MKRFMIGCCAVALMCAFAPGCTGDGLTSSADDTATTAPTSGQSDGFGTRHVTLTCADASGVSIGAGARAGLKVGDVVIGGFTSFMSTVPRAEDVGLRLPQGVHWYFRKAPVMLMAAAAVSVSAARPGQALAWIPFDLWASETPPDLGQWAAATVRLRSCPSKNTWFLGGLLAAHPDACVELQVRTRGGAGHTIHRHLNGRSCAG